MPYVPGFNFDLFLSYAHADSADWIRALELSLRQELQDRLGPEIEVWKDTNNIRFGQKWTDEIENGLIASAALLAVVSPSYRKAEWCDRERETFLDHCQAANQVKAGSYYRFLKLIKEPWPDNDHEEFFKEYQHISFFESRQKSDTPIADISEFVPGTQEWHQRIRQATQAIGSLLELMRRSREPIFLGGAPRDATEPRTALGKELRAQGYDVRPDGNPDEGSSDKLIKKELERAKLSVHVLGPTYKPFVERQIELALELERPLVLWITRAALATVDTAQKQLIARLQADGREWLDSKSAQDFAKHILDKLKPRGDIAGASPQEPAAKRIYLLCDPSTPEDNAFARDVQQQISARERMLVHLPATDSPNASAAHEQLLRESEGLLLYRKSAPEPWLRLTALHVIHAEALGNRTCQSKGFLLNDPSVLRDSPVPLFQPSPQFSLSDIEPFLAKLRTGSAAYAG